VPSYSLRFKKLVVEGGGKLTVESTGQGSVTLEGEEVDVQSGGVIEGDIVTFKVTTFTVRQAALVKCRYKVRVYRTAQSTLHFTSMADLFNQTPSQLLWEAYSNMFHVMRESCSNTYPPQPGTHLYSRVNWSNVE